MLYGHSVPGVDNMYRSWFTINSRGSSINVTVMRAERLICSYQYFLLTSSMATININVLKNLVLSGWFIGNLFKKFTRPAAKQKTKALT